MTQDYQKFLDKYTSIRKRMQGKSFGYLCKRVMVEISNFLLEFLKKFTGPIGGLKNDIYTLNIPLPTPEEMREQYHFFCGETRSLSKISAHASCLKKGFQPHPPHEHDDEELLLLLSGKAELIFEDGTATGERDSIDVEPGDVVYYPARHAHTIEAISEEPANYLMFRWSNKWKEKPDALKFQQFNMFMEGSDDQMGGASRKLVFEGPTENLSKLHCHLSHVESGDGYGAHDDDYDVAIIVLEGEVETIGKRAKPYDVIFYAHGQPHGMYNPGDVTAKYIVFEFHR